MGKQGLIKKDEIRALCGYDGEEEEEEEDADEQMMDMLAMAGHGNGDSEDEGEYDQEMQDALGHAGMPTDSTMWHLMAQTMAATHAQLQHHDY